MDIKHNILTFNPNTGAVLVQYYTDEYIEGLIYSIDVPVVDGKFASKEELLTLIQHMAPKGQLERAIATKTAPLPDYLVDLIPAPVDPEQDPASEIVE